MMAVSTAFAAKSAIDQGRFQKATSRYNARVAENKAVETRNVGNEAELAHRQKVAQLQSKQRAQLGAAGIDLTSGSALQLQEDTAMLGEADALRIRSNAERQASALETSAGLTSAQGDYAQTAGYNQAAGTILSGAATIGSSGVADKWFTPESAGYTGVDLNLTTPSQPLTLGR
jgi:hypothetical protein